MSALRLKREGPDGRVWVFVAACTEVAADRSLTADPPHAVPGDELHEDDDDLTPYTLRRNGRRIGDPEHWQVRHLVEAAEPAPAVGTPAPMAATYEYEVVQDCEALGIQVWDVIVLRGSETWMVRKFKKGYEPDRDSAFHWPGDEDWLDEDGHWRVRRQFDADPATLLAIYWFCLKAWGKAPADIRTVLATLCAVKPPAPTLASLPVPTEADVDAALERAAAGGNLPEEPRYWGLLERLPDGKKKLTRHCGQHDRVIANYNRDMRSKGKDCRGCGEHFIPQRVDGVYCPACRQKQKEARGQS